MIRVIHEIPSDAVDLVKIENYITEVEAGSSSIELYSGPDGSRLILEAWNSEAEFGQFWLARSASEDVALSLAGLASTEIYERTIFMRPDWTWMPIGSLDEGIVMWPHRGPVRVVYLFDAPSLEVWADPIVTKRTLEEPGCEQFTYFRNVRSCSSWVLMEKWMSQTLYDQHWSLRRESGTAILGPGTAAVDQTDDSVEFYQYESFSFLPESWRPLDPEAVSTSVRWSTNQRK